MFEASSRQRLQRDNSPVVEGFRPTTELSREKEVFRYLHAWSSLARPHSLQRATFPDADEPLPAPEPCGDTALTAFAQLCALRMRARRALVSLVSAGTEYVLAEATRTMSLQYDTTEDPADALWLGCCSFPRSDGLNDLAMDQWRKAASYRDTDVTSRHYFKDGFSEHWCIFSDVTERPEFEERAFAQRASDLRFYCSIPLRGPNGVVLGAVSIMDDKPRYGVSAAEMLFLEDIADTICGHLQTSLIRAQQQRSENFIQALGLFNCQKSSLRDWWIGRDNDRIKKRGRYHVEAEPSSQDQQDRLDNEFGKQENAGFSVASVRRLRRTDSETREVHGDGVIPTNPTSKSNANANAARIRQGVVGQDFTPSSIHVQQQRELTEEMVPETAMRSRPKARRAAASVDEIKRYPETFDLAKAIQSTYARASNLVREAIHGEGAVFADARAASAAIRNRRGTGSGSTPSSGEANSSDPNRDYPLRNSSDPHLDSGSNSMSEGDTSDRVSPKRTCTVTGFSTRSRSTLSRSSSTHRFGLTESELRRLIRRYPSGKVFNFADSGGVYSSSGDEDVALSGETSDESKLSALSARKPPVSRDARRLSEIMVGAQTIAFYPIWDDASELFSSALFVWSMTPLRYFDPSVEMNYLAAFGHSLTAELARLNALASERAKGSFISSISHELRSPLHGVLAGAEFLQESHLTPYQQEMTMTITMAGRTLLNTVDQILDYSKISNRSRKPRRSFGGPTPSKAGQGLFAETFDLAKLTEEVVESVTSAHRFEHMSRDTIKPANQPVDMSGTQPPAIRNVAVVMDITKRVNWCVALSKGSWTRVITNLLGNALKYTHSGTVTVSLNAENIDKEQARIMLAIQDTGVGMSKQFVSTDLFTPYKQADSDQVGIGLGLSIVKEIAKDLQAKLDCHSQPSKGTRMSIELDVSFIERGSEDSEDEDRSLLEKSRSFAEVAVHSVDLEANPSSDIPLSVLQAKRSVLSTVAEWLGCTTTSGPLMGFGPQTRACIIAESDLRQLADADSGALSRALESMAETHVRLFVLGQSVLSTMPTMTFEGFPLEPTYVHQPFGPRKMIRTIAGGETHPLPTSPPRSSTYNSGRKATTPLAVRASGRSSGGKVGPSLRDTNLKPIPDRRNPTSPQQGFQSPRSYPGLETSQASPPPQRQQNPSQTDSPSVASSAADTSKIGASQAEQPSEPGDATGSQEQQAVLLVEDNNINMQLLEALMKKLKLPFDTAWNGREALDLWSANPGKYLMILTDISMPVMDGNEATAAIRAEERKRKLPETLIVALTGVIDARAKKASFDAGVNRWFTKPVKMKDLSALVAEVRGEA